MEEVHKKKEAARAKKREEEAETTTKKSSEKPPHKSRPNFTYHRVTTSPNDGRNAFVAVSVVDRRKNAVVTTPSLPEQIKARRLPPWTHARHLRKLQEQMKTLSVAKARLRHRWLEKEQVQESLLTQLSETA